MYFVYINTFHTSIDRWWLLCIRFHRVGTATLFEPSTKSRVVHLVNDHHLSYARYIVHAMVNSVMLTAAWHERERERENRAKVSTKMEEDEFVVVSTFHSLIYYNPLPDGGRVFACIPWIGQSTFIYDSLLSPYDARGRSGQPFWIELSFVGVKMNNKNHIRFSERETWNRLLADKIVWNVINYFNFRIHSSTTNRSPVCRRYIYIDSTLCSLFNAHYPYGIDIIIENWFHVLINTAHSALANWIGQNNKCQWFVVLCSMCQ